MESVEDIRSMHPRSFEWFCKWLLPYLGYEKLFVTRKHGKYEADGGVDIEGLYAGERVLIQCKRNSKARGVLQAVRALRGCMNDEVKRGAFVATQRFTKTTYDEARKYHIELIGIDEIVAIMKRINRYFH